MSNSNAAKRLVLVGALSAYLPRVLGPDLAPVRCDPKKSPSHSKRAKVKASRKQRRKQKGRRA
jgi:hypothetical protein